MFPGLQCINTQGESENRPLHAASSAPSSNLRDIHPVPGCTDVNSKGVHLWGIGLESSGPLGCRIRCSGQAPFPAVLRGSSQAASLNTCYIRLRPGNVGCTGDLGRGEGRLGANMARMGLASPRCTCAPVRTRLLPVLGGMPSRSLAFLSLGGPFKRRTSLGQLAMLLRMGRVWHLEGRTDICDPEAPTSRRSHISPCRGDPLAQTGGWP